MKIVKLVSNKAAEAILEKHTQKEIDNGIAQLVRVEGSEKYTIAMKEKLLEEVAEYLVSDSVSELDDVIQVIKALKGEDSKFSEKWALIATRGHYKNEK